MMIFSKIQKLTYASDSRVSGISRRGLSGPLQVPAAKGTPACLPPKPSLMEILMQIRSKNLAGCRTIVVIGLCAMALAGCGKKDQGAAVSGQVVAHIGEEVVTKQELENEFRWANIPPEKQKDP